MKPTPTGSILYHVRRMLQHSSSGVSDEQLLRRFVTERDEAAFELLLWRHQHMVFAVCRRLLGNVHDAEDAFQATFLTLARKAGSIQKRTSLAAWLHRVAYRIALRLRSSRRKSAHETLDAERLLRQVDDRQQPAADAAEQEVGALLHEEINRLPEKYRVPMVLCYLEGKTCSEAAELLRWPRGTLATRLARGRALLKERLTSRGVTLPATGLAALVCRREAFAVPESLLRHTAQAATTMTTGQAAGFVSERVAVLVEGVVRDMFLTKCKYLAIFSVTLTLLVTAGAWVRLGPVAARQAEDGVQKEEIPALVQKAQPAKAEQQRIGNGKKIQDLSKIIEQLRKENEKLKLLLVLEKLRRERISVSLQHQLEIEKEKSFLLQHQLERLMLALQVQLKDKKLLDEIRKENERILPPKEREKQLFGKVKAIDIKKKTVSLILSSSQLELANVPFAMNAKFFVDDKQRLITDIKPGNEVRLRLERQNDRTVVTELFASTPVEKNGKK